jgi:hypothetical protein
MIEKNNLINHFLEGRSMTFKNPSNELVIKLKEIPMNYERKTRSNLNWIVLLAAACFIGFMVINFLHLNQSSQESNPFDAHFSNFSYYSL